MLSLLYEALLLFAILWGAGLVFQIAGALLGLDHSRWLYQLYLLTVTFGYFGFQWTRGGQTLAMRTWRLRLTKESGSAIDWRTAAVRFLAAFAGTIALGLGFWWAFFDARGRFLHDRLARTRISSLPRA